MDVRRHITMVELRIKPAAASHGLVVHCSQLNPLVIASFLRSDGRPSEERLLYIS